MTQTDQIKDLARGEVGVLGVPFDANSSLPKTAWTWAVAEAGACLLT